MFFLAKILIYRLGIGTRKFDFVGNVSSAGLLILINSVMRRTCTLSCINWMDYTEKDEVIVNMVFSEKLHKGIEQIYEDIKIIINFIPNPDQNYVNYSKKYSGHDQWILINSLSRCLVINYDTLKMLFERIIN